MKRHLISLWLGMACCTVALLSARAAEGFDLEGRKLKQAWLWKAPKPQSVPSVKETRWPLTVEDRFVLSRLEQAGLKPSADADARTWLRRVYFALIGLPPSLEEMRDYLADRKPGARERVVDRLLASPHFGERWARHWMDLMRYAESRGHESDYIIANAWHYRDYLIRAFNEDVPYDQFVKEHLAGDLLPRPRLRAGTDINESVLATGWAFLGEEVHSPVDIRQDECERIDNKVDVMSKTFLGLTVSCARCHDHKFDPIEARDYYALSGFMLGSSFRQVRFEATENNRSMARELEAGRRRMESRLLKTVVGSRRRELREISTYLKAACEVMKAGRLAAGITDGPTAIPVLDVARLNAWVSHLRSAQTNRMNPLHAFARSVAGLSAPVRSSADPEGRVIADYTKPGLSPWKVDGEAFGTRPRVPGDWVVAGTIEQPTIRLMTYGAARRDRFWLPLKAAPGNENDSGQLAATSRAGQMIRTPTVTLAHGSLHYLIRGKTRVYAAVDSHLMVEGPLHGQLVRRFDSGPGTAPRWVSHDLTAYAGHRVHVEFGPDGDADLEVLKVVESEHVPTWEPVAWFEPTEGFGHVGAYAQAFQHAVEKATAALTNRRLAALPDSSREATLANWALENVELLGGAWQGEARERLCEVVTMESRLGKKVRWESRTAVAWFDGTGVDEHILVRGKPSKPAEVSQRSLPTALGLNRPITTSTSSGRLELAEQVVHPENPMVSRTVVNRVWHHLYGRGLVSTVDNFGALGEPPSHPELLDHLAWQFVYRDHWSMKRLIKRLVLSRTFAMSSETTDARAEERDPTNQLIHRMPVRRLEGEVIRDALLAVSGRLNPAVYGPPVPVHLNEFLIGRGRPDKSGPLDGEGRRSIYTGIRRNFIPTLMQTFDVPTPFSTVGKRNVTNVPAQSLALMNDPLFHQQAKVWAERLIRSTPGLDPSARVRWLFETAYGREPAAAELRECLDARAEFARFYESGSADAVEVWTELCHALVNANDFIYVK